MGYSEFIEWLAFYETEPFGELRAEIHTAMLAATIVNVQRGKKGKAIKASKFITDWWRDKSKPQALMAKFRALTARVTNDNGARTRNINGSSSNRKR